MLRHLTLPLLELLFPSRCWITRAPISPEEDGLSHAVRETIARSVDFPYCARCGMTTGPYTSNDRRDPCVNCEKRNLGVAAIARVGTFAPPLSDLVKRLKYQKRWEFAPLLAPFVVQAIHRQLALCPDTRVDALVPVPLHWRRRIDRGFNQAEEIARAASKLTGWPVLASAIRRTRNTHAQSTTQSATARKDNLHDAFVARHRVDVAGKHVWLLDDVCTTGATLHAAALAFKRLPREMRPARICAVVVCVTDRTPVPDAPARELEV